MSGARHLYVHIPFCASRCDYCDFVSLTGQRDQQARYVEVLLADGQVHEVRHLPNTFAMAKPYRYG